MHYANYNLQGLHVAKQTCCQVHMLQSINGVHTPFFGDSQPLWQDIIRNVRTENNATIFLIRKQGEAALKEPTLETI